MKKMDEDIQELHDKRRWIENTMDNADGKRKRHAAKRVVIRKTKKPAAAASSSSSSASMVKVEDEYDEREEEVREDKYLDELAGVKGWKTPGDKAAARALIAKLEERIHTADTRRQVKEDNKAVALGTSKINYMDPRITVVWCKASETPIEKVFNKSLLDKFPWAMEVPPTWQF